MLTSNIADMTLRTEAHIAADLLMQGAYYDSDTGTGCFIGCFAHDNHPEYLADTYGIPVPLVRALEWIFERLPKAEAAAFFRAIPVAIGTDGKDLSRVVWRFLGETLRALPPQSADMQAVIDRVITGMDLLADGQKWSGAGAAAVKAARAAAAARPAGVAAWPAAAAEAARASAAAAERVGLADEEVMVVVAMTQATRAAAEASWAAATRRRAARAAEDMAVEIVRQRDSILRLMRDAPMVRAA